MFRTGCPNDTFLGVSSPNQESGREGQPGVGGHVASSNQSHRSSPLAWVEYSHNLMTYPATGLSPSEALLGYHPPLLSVTEGEHEVPLVQHHLRRCQHLWRSTQAAFLRISEQNKKLADCHRTVPPPYTQGQKVWLSTKNVPLRSESKKLAPHFIGPFDITTMINPVTARLTLIRNMKIHNIFHVSQLKRVRFSSLDR